MPPTKKANSIFIILENWLSYDWSLQELNKTQRGNTQFPKSVRRKEQKYRWQMHRKNFSAGHTKSTSLNHCSPVRTLLSCTDELKQRLNFASLLYLQGMQTVIVNKEYIMYLLGFQSVCYWFCVKQLLQDFS